MATHDFPSPAAVYDFISITQVTDELATRWLQRANNNVGNAVDQYFEKKGVLDEDPMPALVPDVAHDFEPLPFHRSTDNPGFSVQGPDELGPTYGDGAGAPSRPPSRTNNKSPLDPLNGAVDMTMHNATGQARFLKDDSDTTIDEEEKNIQEATIRSLQECGSTPRSSSPQQTGIISHGSFKPATRSDYEPAHQESVSTVSREIDPEPEPELRKRDLAAPAFLRSGKGDHRLGALLTIYHEIPILREIFLNRKDCLANYGHNDEWWCGTSSIEVDTLVIDDEQEPKSDFTYELQRLMAFLDITTRRYGSTAALERTREVQEELVKARGDIETATLNAFKMVSEPALTKTLFSKVEGPNQSFAIMPLSFPANGSLNETIYDMADEALWIDSPLDISAMPYLSHVSDVVTFKFIGWANSNKKQVDVPLVWYPDRYLESGQAAALDMRLKKDNIKGEIEEISRLEEKLIHHRKRVGGDIKKLDVKDLFKVCRRHDEAGNVEDTGIDVLVAAFGEADEFDQHENTDSDVDLFGDGEHIVLHPPNFLSDELSSLEKRIDEKLLTLQHGKEKAINELRELSKLYTADASAESDTTDLTRYTLRGVSTSSQTMYIRRVAEPDLIRLDLSATDEAGNSWAKDEWWRINSATGGSNPVEVERISEERVLVAAKSETSPLLVYARDSAMTSENKPLPRSLQAFVREDNDLFKAELPPDIGTPKSPLKRKSSEISSDNEQSPERVSSGNADWAGLTSKINPIEGNSTTERVIIGLDPKDSPGQEMQERRNHRLVGALPLEPIRANEKIDSMDLDEDEVMKDDDVVEESKAAASIRHVEFADAA